jgi:cytochrome bd ubiquinol oxidase subunit II
MLESLPLVFVLVGLTLYTVLGGADFGAGFWQLFAGGDGRAQEVREWAHRSMAPVWEANHVWLIFVITVFWTAYPKAFGSIASTLAVPLFVALVGIIFRGAAYALRAGASSARESALLDTLFSLSSILTPFALGVAIGAVATDRVPVGNAAGGFVSSWLNPTSIVLGVLAVVTSAFLAATYLAADAAREGSEELELAFRWRALAAGVAAGAVAIAGIFVAYADKPKLFHSLLDGRALPAVIVSAAAGVASLVLVHRRRFEWARYSAAIAVAAITAGWALSRWPTILPGLTVHQAAAGHDTLVAVVVAVLAGAVLLLPALALLFGLALTGRFRADEYAPIAHAMRPRSGPAVRPRVVAREALACLIVGFGLLNVADAGWAHAVGVVSLVGFVVLAFRAIIFAGIVDAVADR